MTVVGCVVVTEEVNGRQQSDRRICKTVLRGCPK